MLPVAKAAGNLEGIKLPGKENHDSKAPSKPGSLDGAYGLPFRSPGPWLSLFFLCSPLFRGLHLATLANVCLVLRQGTAWCGDSAHWL